jgi:hypothetical protein
MGLQNPVHRFDSGRRLSKKAPLKGFFYGPVVVQLGENKPGDDDAHGDGEEKRSGQPHDGDDPRRLLNAAPTTAGAVRARDLMLMREA